MPLSTKHESIEYKYVKVRQDGVIGQWEPTENRHLSLKARRCTRTPMHPRPRAHAFTISRSLYLSFCHDCPSFLPRACDHT